MTHPASQLAPPTLHWGIVGPSGDTCDLCSATIKPHGDCYLSIRRAFELAPDHRRMVETAPISVLMCIPCGLQRPDAPKPTNSPPDERPTAPTPLFTSEGGKPPHEPASEPRGASDAAPDYFDAGVMGDPRD